MRTLPSRLVQLLALLLVMLSLMGSSHEGSEAYALGRFVGTVVFFVLILAVVIKLFTRKR